MHRQTNKLNENHVDRAGGLGVALPTAWQGLFCMWPGEGIIKLLLQWDLLLRLQRSDMY